MIQEILGQAVGIIAVIVTAISYQVNTKKILLLLQSAATISLCASYLLLGATAGFAVNIVCLARNACFYFQKEGQKTFHTVSTLLSIAAMVVLGVLSWQGALSLLVILALSANTYFLSLGKPQALRYSILVTSTMVLTYNIFVFSIGGILNESIAIASSLVGIFRFRGAKLRPESDETA